jgi:hypothetical protein
MEKFLIKFEPRRKSKQKEAFVGGKIFWNN